MPRRSVLTPAERTSLLAFPTTNDELIRHYTFSAFDLASIRQRRGNHNRLGFAVQLCYLRYPGFALPTQGEPPAALPLSDGNCTSSRTAGRSTQSVRKPAGSTWQNCRRG